MPCRPVSLPYSICYETPERQPQPNQLRATGETEQEEEEEEGGEGGGGGG